MELTYCRARLGLVLELFTVKENERTERYRGTLARYKIEHIIVLLYTTSTTNLFLRWVYGFTEFFWYMNKVQYRSCLVKVFFLSYVDFQFSVHRAVVTLKVKIWT